MRALIQIVSVFFIIVGVVIMVGVLVQMIADPPRSASLQIMMAALISVAAPGGIFVIFGSVAYMLCSIDTRLEEMANRPPPRVTVAAPAQQPPATFTRDHDLF